MAKASEAVVEADAAQTDGFVKRGTTALVAMDPEELLNDKGALALLKKAATASEKDFVDLEKDFWKPTVKGEAKQGIFLGSERGTKADGTPKKMLVHVIGVLGEKGKPLPLRVNGTAILTRALKRIRPGTPVRLEYLGETRTLEGDRLAEWDVKPLAGSIE